MLKNYRLTLTKKRSGFTLAEVLVTLAIIGVVTALTIPALIHNTKNQQILSGVKKAYSEFSQAYTSFIAEDVDMDTLWAGTSQSAAILNQFATKLNVVKNCGTGTGCFPDVTYITLNGAAWTNINQNTGRSKAILADGTTVYIYDNPGPVGCTTDNGDGALNNTCGNFVVDINGFKGPNQMGRDAFPFFITKSGVLPYGSNNDAYVGSCTISGAGQGCSAQILLEGAVNY